jgi:hypothetical protein
MTLKQHSAFLLQGGQQLVLRMGECGDAVGQQFLRECPQGDTQLDQASQRPVGVLLSRSSVGCTPAVMSHRYLVTEYGPSAAGR